MSSQPKTWIGATIGSTIGGMIPALWGAGIFSFSSIIFSAIGAIIGVYVAFKLAQY
jgi:uncharacterized membrane protein YeaQ/YmgE (transglycosylase-associated protein family)